MWSNWRGAAAKDSLWIRVSCQNRLHSFVFFFVFFLNHETRRERVAPATHQLSFISLPNHTSEEQYQWLRTYSEISSANFPRNGLSWTVESGGKWLILCWCSRSKKPEESPSSCCVLCFVLASETSVQLLFSKTAYEGVHQGESTRQEPDRPLAALTMQTLFFNLHLLLGSYFFVWLSNFF